MRRLPLFVLAASLLLSFALGRAAGATSAASKLRQQARASGDGLIATLLDGGKCDETTARGFINKTSYLAACGKADGSFQYFAIVNAAKGKFDTKSPYVQAQIDQLCAGSGGAVYAAGVNGEFVVLYTGTGRPSQQGSGAATALSLRDDYAHQLSSTKGHATFGYTCANGQVVPSK
jgi:hypothetical protein